MSVRAVVVAHREALVAEGIAAGLSRFPALQTVGVATTAAELEGLADRADAAAVDARLPGAHGAIRRLQRRGVRVVVLGAQLTDSAEVDGVTVPMGSPLAMLARALVPGVSDQPARGGARLAGLTSRELSVLRLGAKGMPGKQIARTLGISPKTVEQHRTRIHRKLGVPNQTAAVALLAEGGR